MGCHSGRIRHGLLLGSFAISLAFGIAAFFGLRQRTIPAVVSRETYLAAAAEFEELYGIAPSQLDVLSLLGESSVMNQDWDLALACFSAIPSSQPVYGHRARFQQGQVLLRLYRALGAETQFREFLELQSQTHRPDEADMVLDALDRLQNLLAIELRFEERQQLLARIVHSGRADSRQVLLYCFPTVFRWNGTAAAQQLEKMWANAPEDRQLQTAAALYRASHGRLAEAERILRTCLDKSPQHKPAQAALLYTLREAGRWDAMKATVEQTPAPDGSDPWFLNRQRGHLLNHLLEFASARRCFELAIQQDPTSPEAWAGYGVSSSGLDDDAAVTRARMKSQILSRIQNRLGWSLQRPAEPQPLLEIARLCLDGGFQKQAELIVACALQLSPGNLEVLELQQKLHLLED